jgi:hypothetical protein
VWTPTNLTEGNYTVVAETSALVDENDTLNNVGASDPILIKADDTAPVIGFPIQDPPADRVHDDDFVRIDVNVSDEASGVLQVLIEYQYHWADYTTEWFEAIMSNYENQVYSYVIARRDVGDVVSYGIRAYDRAGHESLRDNAGRYYVYTVIAIPEFPSSVLLVFLMLLSTLVALAPKRNRLKPLFCKHESS